MPLCLAGDSTCVILAGDHLQMTQTVHSNEARALGFDRSLTERLDQLYSGDWQQVDGSLPVVRLLANYRNHAEITAFLSSTLYNNQLISRSDELPVPDLLPLNFYAVNAGYEVQDQDSTSFYNMHEVEELVTRVKELCSRWPVQWGKDGRDILVTAAYSDQASGTSFKKSVSVMYAK